MREKLKEVKKVAPVLTEMHALKAGLYSIDVVFTSVPAKLICKRLLRTTDI